MALLALQKLAIDAHMIRFRIGLASEFGDNFAVHLDVSRRDQFLGLPPGSNARRRNDFLESLKRHIFE